VISLVFLSLSLSLSIIYLYGCKICSSGVLQLHLTMVETTQNTSKCRPVTTMSRTPGRWCYMHNHRRWISDNGVFFLQASLLISDDEFPSNKYTSLSFFSMKKSSTVPTIAPMWQHRASHYMTAQHNSDPSWWILTRCGS
jgi:hypothetical protein